MKNEFQVGKPVSGKEFIGREKEINELVQLLKSGQSVVLIAPRRFGKTSLMMKVLEIVKSEGMDTCYVDIFTTPDIKRLAESFTSGILDNHKLGKILTVAKKNIAELFKSAEFKTVLEDFEFVLKFGQANTDPWELMENSIDFADSYTRKYKSRLVAGLDEFGDIEKLGGIELAKLFRSKIQIQKSVSYIFAGSYESVMNQLFTTAKSPFYRFARIIQLQYIDTREFQKLYSTKLNEAGLDTNEKLIEKILQFTQGHPYYSSLYLQQWLLYKTIPEDVEAAFQYLTGLILNIEKPYLEKLWEEISSGKDQRSLILSLVESGKPYSVLDVKRINISRTINILRNKGFILKKKDGYGFTDPIFELWIRREIIK